MLSCSKEPAKFNANNNDTYTDTIIVELPLNDNIDDVTTDIESIINESEATSEEISDSSDTEEVFSIEEASDDFSVDSYDDI